MIKLEHINKYYSLEEEQLHVLKDINFEINEKEFVAVMGPSGSGKSTLINLIGFIDKKFEGKYLFEGKEITDFSDKDLSAIRNRSVGFVFQNFSLIENNTVFENIELPLLYNGSAYENTKERVQEVLEKVGLPDKGNKYPKQLSGGQQQRVAIARAIVNSPKFIIADEPTGALDSKTSEDIMQLFQELNRKEGATIILVTHNPEMVSYCDRLIRVKDGMILEEELIK
ncbi:ABC transporter ATP-binding protein [Enterococcus sp. DIV0242_7C1]|uniref:ABC transporter ATP-binding protein n=1 Tax=Candidatus Enterococcus dunnyi TaxID=1834192 RepID=A0A200JG32_9ENTE|nr:MULTISPECIES: ABC transporter ATP-binding protein [unclassified Enterococcus]MBO0469149.1 ABC transporter ATP-binding protein [Enterococcus sp. DIV0242_7C1]MCA5012733.1 ABC transporter ATP-binding protein [Enterococcus sp. S23]MCA5015984.1 ABC transporter ATP-binding protein [Enterococcus sp. S22(2020)]OUZ35557.1 ABC transporter ATP-binding protein [Enterococcus sp. 9D6_DIV0238]